MDRAKKSSLFLFIIFLTAGLFLLQPSARAADEQQDEEVLAEGVYYVRGLISSIDAKEMQIGVKPVKEKRLIIRIGPDTELEGFTRLDELEKKQQVKVWYKIVDGENLAIKLVKMMELGC